MLHADLSRRLAGLEFHYVLFWESYSVLLPAFLSVPALPSPVKSALCDAPITGKIG